MKGEKFVVKSPILGFEEVNEVEFAEVDNGALAFLSMIGNDAELLLINPYKVREYSFEVPANIQALLDIKADSNVKVFCVFVREKQTEIRINFLAPIILNCDNHTLAQVILNAKDYPRFGVAESIKDYIKE
ncbi:protein FliW [Helicobacter pullorum MIT 98-5489]|uniref:Flagellar assembly protein FliW n=2 Tax=Helicobacter pullorum TaxID=35818 RepID=A0A0N1ECN5_9HELI|nr:flagellar assembly protein FliW [Helicobacter pullorum]HIS09394.1 flagellar assembly protein FliW [Candidatus Scatomorpha intestinipullorum]EEQ62798.1 protein FliW [Helicobacter pullorum MIT 98-5489]KPH56313.1 flagellar assembly protein FliW [Helicobacter pullorum]STQ87895.1 flagellar assembly protein FliW [Helicobacter pullorum]VEJ07931.1 flagellar assembly protein FliW [Helicobacter pullorum]